MAGDNLSTREIKELLQLKRVDFSDCFEKSDLVRRLRNYQEKENEDKVQEIKALANSAFGRGGFALAIRYYTEALVLCDDSSEVAAQLRSNRSIALLKLDQVAKARWEAEECTRKAPWFSRGYLRLGNAAARQGDYTWAAHACLQGLKNLAEAAATSPSPSPPGAGIEHPSSGGVAAGGGEPAVDSPAAVGAATADVKLRKELEDLLQQQLAVLGWTVETLELNMGLRACEQEQSAHRSGMYSQSQLVAPAGCKLLEELSEDLIADFLGQHLSAAEICNVSKCCRSLRTLCVFGDKAAKIWLALCERTWAQKRGDISEEACQALDWRTHCLERAWLDVRWAQGLQKSSVSVLKSDNAPVFNVMMYKNTLVSAEDCCVRIFDLARKKCTKTFQCHQSGHRMVLGVWMDEECTTCISGGADGDVKVWDMKDGICKRVLAGHGGAVVSVKADKDKICSTSFDGMARVWSWAGRNELALEGHRGHVCGLWLQPLEEGTCVWTGADDGLVKKWDINTGTCVCEFSQEAISDTGMRLDTPCSVWCVHGTSGSAIVTGSTDASVRVWDTNSGREVCKMSGHQDAVAGLQLDNDKIVTSGFDGTVRVWDWRTWRCRGVVDLLQASRSNISPHQRRCTRLSMDQHKVLVGCIDGTIYCIDVY